MTTKQIKNLATVSYVGEKLDEKKVTKIVKLLTKTELKRYVKCLKNLEQGKTVKIIMSKLDNKNELTKNLKGVFPNKKLEFIEDKSLIAGIKLVDNDIIYDFNLANTFENLVSYINQ